MPDNYPQELEIIRSTVIQTLDDPFMQNRLMRCRFTSRCNSSYCPFCCIERGRDRKRRILGTVSNVRHHPRFVTFTTRDVPIEQLRETSRELMACTRLVMERLRVAGHVQCLEVSFRDGGEYHPHTHTLVDTPSEGRSFLSKAAWQEEWLRALPKDLHPPEGGVHAESVRSLEAVSDYITKSPFHAYVRERERQLELVAVRRTVATIRATEGLQKINRRGSFGESAHCALAA